MIPDEQRETPIFKNVRDIDHPSPDPHCARCGCPRSAHHKLRCEGRDGNCRCAGGWAPAGTPLTAVDEVFQAENAAYDDRARESIRPAKPLRVWRVDDARDPDKYLIGSEYARVDGQWVTRGSRESSWCHSGFTGPGEMRAEGFELTEVVYLPDTPPAATEVDIDPQDQPS